MAIIRCTGDGMVTEYCQQLSVAGVTEGEYRLLPDGAQTRDFSPLSWHNLKWNKSSHA